MALDEHRRVLARLGARRADRLRGPDDVAHLAGLEHAGAERRRHLVAAADRDHRLGSEPARLGERGGHGPDRLRRVPELGEHRRIDPRRVQHLGRPGLRPRIEQGHRGGVRRVDRGHTGRVAEDVGAGRHQVRGLSPELGLLVADPQRLEHRVGRVEVRAHGTVEVAGRDPLGEGRRLRLGPAVHPDQRGAQAAPRRVAHDHAVELRAEREPADRGRTTGTLGDQLAGTPSPRRPSTGRGPAPPIPGAGTTRSYASYAEATSSPSAPYRAAFVPWLPTSQPITYGRAHGMTTIFSPVPARIVSNASAIFSSGHRCVTTFASSSCLRAR